MWSSRQPYNLRTWSSKGSEFPSPTLGELRRSHTWVLRGTTESAKFIALVAPDTKISFFLGTPTTLLRSVPQRQWCGEDSGSCLWGDALTIFDPKIVSPDGLPDRTGDIDLSWPRLPRGWKSHIGLGFFFVDASRNYILDFISILLSWSRNRRCVSLHVSILKSIWVGVQHRISCKARRSAPHICKSCVLATTWTSSSTLISTFEWPDLKPRHMAPQVLSGLGKQSFATTALGVLKAMERRELRTDVCSWEGTAARGVWCFGRTISAQIWGGPVFAFFVHWCFCLLENSDVHTVRVLGLARMARQLQWIDFALE